MTTQNKDLIAQLQAGTIKVNRFFKGYTHLDGANLAGATLDGANLDGATLDGANLFGASLRDATLTGATLAGAEGIAAAYIGRYFVFAYVNNNKILVQAGCRNQEIGDMREYIGTAKKHDAIRDIALAYFKAFELQLSPLLN